MFELGQKVRISNEESCFFEESGTIIEIRHRETMFRIVVKFETNGSTRKMPVVPFKETELEIIDV
jgi:hypothetical protein